MGKGRVGHRKAQMMISWCCSVVSGKLEFRFRATPKIEQQKHQLRQRHGSGRCAWTSPKPIHSTKRSNKPLNSPKKNTKTNKPRKLP